jgi:hypothetical protein
VRIDSRDINDLRPDVAANVRIGVKALSDMGFPVGFSSTYRNDEQQAYLYEQGRTRPGQIVTNSRVTTFHGARLAFDVFQNVKGKEWSDNAFWTAASAVFKGLGFSWGYDWATFKEKPHFQWDNHGKYTGAQVRAGILPPPMPLWEDEDMTPERFAELYDQINPMIKSIDDPKLPASLRPEVQKLLDSGAINGGTPTGVNARDINLRLETLKAIIVAKR